MSRVVRNIYLQKVFITCLCFCFLSIEPENLRIQPWKCFSCPSYDFVLHEMCVSGSYDSSRWSVRVVSPPCGHPHWSIKTRKKMRNKKSPSGPENTGRVTASWPTLHYEDTVLGTPLLFHCHTAGGAKQAKRIWEWWTTAWLKKKWMKERLLMGMRPGFSKEPASKASHWLGGVAANPKQVPLVLC